MSEEEITALAREYAEEIVQDTDSYPELPVCLLNEMREEVAEDFEEKIRFLLHRFCLVEKSKIESIHKGIVVQLDPKNFGYSSYNQGRMDVLKSLFPEIAKEVEK